jgi:hypothetical protein
MALLDGEFTIYQQILRKKKNVSQIGREKFKKKNVFFFVLHILYSHKQQKIPTIPKNTKKKIIPSLTVEERKTFNCQSTEEKKS